MMFKVFEINPHFGMALLLLLVAFEFVFFGLEIAVMPRVMRSGLVKT